MTQFVKLIVATTGLVSFVLGFLFQFDVLKYISMDKVKQIDDPKKLYICRLPPMSILNRKGKIRLFIVYLCFGIAVASFFTFLGICAFT